MSGLENSGIIIVNVAFTVLLLEIIIYITRMARTAGGDAGQHPNEKDDGFLSTVQSGFPDIVRR